MKIFLSWSGGKSKALAEMLREWIPDVVQSVEPFVSTQDISIGDRPLNVLASELESTSFGIVCVTQQNKLTPWITFEAGALSKIVDTSKVIPLLLDLKVSDLTGPLSQFQAVSADNEDQVFKLIREIAAASPPPSIAENRLRRAFDAFWPALRDKVDELRRQPDGVGGTKENARSDREILEELLGLARRNDRDNVISEASAHAAVMSELRRYGVSYKAHALRGALHIDLDQGYLPDPAEIERLRDALQALAARFATAIYIDSGPFGADAFPPF